MTKIKNEPGQGTAGVMRALLLMLISGALCPFLFAQGTIQHTEGKDDQILRGRGGVNPSSLGLEINIPLSGFAGRAGSDLPVSIGYSSKVWRLDYLGTWKSGLNTKRLIFPVFAENSASGWTSSLDPPRLEFISNAYDEFGENAIDPADALPGTVIRYVNLLLVHMPDGSSHELRKNITFDKGDPVNVGIFYAVDGSQMKFDAAANTLWLPNGSRYIFDTFAQIRHIDRNGNRLTYNGLNRQWTDTLGRVIKLPLPQSSPSVGDVSYTLPGVAGSPTHKYTFRWKALEAALAPGFALKYSADHKNTAPYDAISPSLFTSTGELIISSPQLFNPVVLAEVVLPNQTSYKFEYNAHGEIVKVSYPTGAYERYTYQSFRPFSFSPLGSSYLQTNRGVQKRFVSPDGVNENAEWNYRAGYADDFYGQPYKVSITAPDGTVAERLLHNCAGAQPWFGFEDARDGLVEEERLLATGGAILNRALTQWVVSSGLTSGFLDSRETIYPVQKKHIQVLLDTGTSNALAAVTTFEYTQTTPAPNLTATNLTATNDYGFLTVSQGTGQTGNVDAFSPGAALLTRRTETAYLDSPAYSARDLIALPSSTTIKDSSGAQAAQTLIRYDETPPATYATLTNWEDPQTLVRGNVTTEQHWLDFPASTYRSVQTGYDQAGNIISRVDPLGNTSTISYDDSYSDGIGRTTFAFPTLIRSAVADPTAVHGLDTPLETRNVYDFSTSLIKSVTNANNQTETSEYNDPFNRVTRVTRPTGGGATSISYGDAIGDLFIHSSIALDASRARESYSYFDGLGRPIRTVSYDGATSLPWIAVDTHYDALSRVASSTNPYRVLTPSSTVSNCAGAGVVCAITNYDQRGRVSTITTPDNAVVTTQYSADVMTVTDQSGRARSITRDGLGRVVRVTENPGGFNQEASFITNYAYNVLDDLVQVTQGVQTRSFMYDSLGRLIRSRLPEQEAASGLDLTDPITGNNHWSMAYAYDLNDNIKTQTDARGVTVRYDYDAQNRLITRRYQGVDTPQVDYFYDGKGLSAPVANALGRITLLSSAASSYSYASYDAMGRVTQSSQTTGGQTYSMAYGYDLSGNLISEQYPSGRTIATSYDFAGRSSKVQEGTKVYADTFSYTSHGAIESLRLGNNLWEKYSYNVRLQPTEIDLGTGSAGSTDRLKLTYGYAPVIGGTPDPTRNNGNVQSHTIDVPGIATITQSYSYDSLNRLQTAQENGGSSWTQNYKYDQFGNRTFDAGTNYPLGFPNPSFDQNTNRISAAGYGYDPAGNLSIQPFHSFAFDAENRQVTFDNGAANGGAEYVYDGSGQRVKSITPSGTTIYVYDAMQRLVAEYSSASQTTSGLTYITVDSTNTPRVTTDAAGVVKGRHDYLPFGEEIGLVGQRSAAQGYTADSVRQKFTGKERDVETGLDWFGPGRYYSSSQGRFTSVDPVLASGKAPDPQSWNRYSYGLNNPLKYSDPLGMWVYAPGTSGDDQKQFEKSLKQLRDALEQFGRQHGRDSADYKRLARALDAYGDKNVDNGVTVRFDRNDETPGRTSPHLLTPNDQGIRTVTTTNPIGQDTVVTINPAKNDNDLGFALTVAHEGSHVADAAALYGALPKDLKLPIAAGLMEGTIPILGGMNPNQWQTETKAYVTEAFAARLLVGSRQTVSVGGNPTFQIWNPAWAEADRATNLSRGIFNILVQPKSQGGVYHLNPFVGDMGKKFGN